MKIKYLVVFAIISVLFVGCTTQEAPPKTESSKSGSGSVSASSKPQESAPSAPTVDFTSNAALHRDILVNYGADITTGTDDKPLEAHQGTSLFLREDWGSEHPMEGFGYFA